jgi:hypothetical protein
MLSTAADLGRAGCCQQENFVQIYSGVSGFLISRRSRADRGGRMGQAGASDVVGRPERRLSFLADGQMGWPSGECRLTEEPLHVFERCIPFDQVLDFVLDHPDRSDFDGRNGACSERVVVLVAA